MYNVTCTHTHTLTHSRNRTHSRTASIIITIIISESCVLKKIIEHKLRYLLVVTCYIANAALQQQKKTVTEIAGG